MVDIPIFGDFFKRKKSIFKALQGSRNPAAAADEFVAAKAVDRHNRAASKKAAEFDHIAGLFAIGRDDADSGCFKVDHTDSSLVRDNGGDSTLRGIAGNGNHVKTD